MGWRYFSVLGRLRQRRQHGVVVETEKAQKLIGRGQFDDLRERQPGKQIGQFRRQAQAEHPDRLVLAQHTLCEHDVRQINLADRLPRLAATVHFCVSEAPNCYVGFFAPLCFLYPRRTLVTSGDIYDLKRVLTV